jgi:hypothetical protein
MKILLSFLLGVLLGVVGTWTFTRAPRSVDVERVEVEAGERGIDRAADRVDDSLERAGDQIENSLERAGDAIRDKAREVGDGITDATRDARISAEIKSKLIRETALAAFKIDVDTANGVVTLSGTVASPDDIARALEIARSTSGVKEVASTLQVQARD